MKRTDISQLERNRSIYFKVGLICSLSIFILAFNWTIYEDDSFVYQLEEIPIEQDIPVIRTKQEEAKKLPPPIFKTEKIIETEEVEFLEEPIPEQIKEDVEHIVEESLVEQVKVSTPTAKKTVAPILEPEEKITKEKPFFLIVESMPRFGECEHKLMSKEEQKQCSDVAIFKYFGKNIKYPPIARENGISGTVVVEFIVDEKGKVTHPKVLKDIGGGCGQEALRVINSMPDWKAGKQRGREVKVQMRIPIRFRLEQ